MNRRTIIWIAGALAAVAAIAWWVYEHRYDWTARNFGVVEPGRIYRGGHQRPLPLSRILRQHHIKTVLCLRSEEDEWIAAEREVLDQHGVTLRQVTIKGGGAELLASVEEAVAILADPANQPIFVHCWAGKHRTGGAVALYRVQHGGWSKQAAHEELERWGVSRDDPLAWPHQLLDFYCAQSQQALTPRE